MKAHIILGEDADGVDAAGRSTQLPEDTWDYQKIGAKEPPYNLDALLCVFLEINTWHYRCVKAKRIRKTNALFRQVGMYRVTSEWSNTPVLGLELGSCRAIHRPMALNVEAV